MTLMTFRSSIPTHSIYTQTHNRLTFVLVLACHCAFPLVILLSVRHSSICVSMSPCTVSRWPSACTFRPSIRAIYITVAFAYFLRQLSHIFIAMCTPCTATVSAAAAAAAAAATAAPWPQYLFTSHLLVRWSCHSGCYRFVVSVPADLSLVIVGAQLCLCAD